jgi:hypothetical protein
MYEIHFKAPIILGSGMLYPVYKLSASNNTPTTDCAGASLLKAAANARKSDFTTIAAVKMNKIYILGGD